MSNMTSKPFTNYSEEQVLQKAYNPADATIAVGSFVAAELNNNIQVNYPTSSSETYSYYEASNLLYTLTVVYTDSTKANLMSITRTT